MLIDWGRVARIAAPVVAIVCIILLFVIPLSRNTIIDSGQLLVCKFGFNDACEQKQYGCDKLTLVAIDISNPTAVPNDSRSDVQNSNQISSDTIRNYRDFIEKLLKDSNNELNGLIIQPGSCVYAEQFAGDVLTKKYPSKFENIPYKDPSKIDDPAIVNAQKNVENDFDELLNKLHVEKPGSEIWNESIKMASKIEELKNEKYIDGNGKEKIRFNPDGEVTLYIYSAMLECSLGVIGCFDYPNVRCEKVQEMIDDEADKGNIPDLHGVHVIVKGVGEGANDPNGDLFKTIDCSWHYFFEKAGADICSSCFTND